MNMVEFQNLFERSPLFLSLSGKHTNQPSSISIINTISLIKQHDQQLEMIKVTVVQLTFECNIRSNMWELYRGMSKFKIEMNIFIIRVMKQWNSLPPEVYVHASSLRFSNQHRAAILSWMVWRFLSCQWLD